MIPRLKQVESYDTSREYFKGVGTKHLYCKYVNEPNILYACTSSGEPLYGCNCEYYIGNKLFKSEG